MTTLLIVYDNPQYLLKITDPLEQEGYAVVSLNDPGQIASQLVEIDPLLVIFNVDLDTYNPHALCESVRLGMPATPVPILFIVPLHFSARQVAQILDAGADDVLKRPFSPPELKARLRALVRRSPKPVVDEMVRLQLDANTHSVQIGQRVIELTPVEFELLNFLCKTRPNFHTAPDLLQHLWDYPPQGGDTALVRNHIRNLRLKLETDPDRPRVLVSQYGRGYSVRALVQQA